MSLLNRFDEAQVSSDASFEQSSGSMKVSLQPLPDALQTTEAEQETPDEMEITQKIEHQLIRSPHEAATASDAE